MNKAGPAETSLTWDATYEIAVSLKAEHPAVDLEQVSLRDIFTWTLALSTFSDAAELANDEILAAIYQDWFEELDTP